MVCCRMLDKRQPPPELQSLTHQLQDYVQSHSPVWLVVRCAIWKQYLVLLGVHAHDPRVSSSQLFMLLTQALQTVVTPHLVNLPCVADGRSQPVQLCLKIAGQAKIYATHCLQLHCPQLHDMQLAELPVAPSLAKSSGVEPSIAPLSLTPAQVGQAQVAPTHAALEHGTLAQQRLEGISPAQPVQPRRITTGLLLPHPSSQSALLAKRRSRQRRSRGIHQFSGTTKPSRGRSWLWQGIILVPVLLGAVYGLTRPCVIGACPHLQASQQTNQHLRQQIPQATSLAELKRIRSQLNDLMASVQVIPMWSPHYSQAARQIQAYSAQARNLERVIAADELVAQSGQPLIAPRSLTEWSRLQAHWRGSIALLMQIPPDSVAYPLAAARLPTHRAALADIDRHYAQEKQATACLAEAKRIAQIAIARQELAQSPESWRFVKTTWLSAVKQLQSVPNHTLAKQEATALLNNYTQQATKAEQQLTTELAMAKTYHQAQKLGQQAKEVERQQQWSAAMQAWQGAIDHAQKIPPSSFYYPSAQALLSTYKLSLMQTQQALRLVDTKSN